ncbi:enterochelin esterase family protein [Rhodococcus sp. 27YEA15]|uniref:enterochelin esterase n=1 Tax=Rhodococcus sp. 27YEA15 TaxID=3156259 RepID=UPI003C7AC940
MLPRKVVAPSPPGPEVSTIYQHARTHGSPVIEDVDAQTVRVTFLWRQPDFAAVERVYLDVNSVTDHHAEKLTTLTRSSDGTWTQTLEVPRTWRGSYSFIPVTAETVRELDSPGAGQDDAGRRRRWLGLLEHRISDPLNPHSAGIDSRRSAAHMPGAPAQFGWDAHSSRMPTEVAWKSRSLGVNRSVWVYETLHDGVTRPEDRPLVILLDGRHWAQVMPAGAAFDRAVETGKLRSCVLLAIDSVDREVRSRELPCNRDFWQAIVDELIPQIRTIRPFTEDRTRTLVSGQSYGGLASMFAALEFPEHFGLVASGSGSFWWPTPFHQGADCPSGGDIAARIVADGAPDGLRVVLEAGLHEGDMVRHSAAVADALEAAGVSVTSRVFDGGHDWLCWRSALLDSVIDLVGAP